MSANYYDLIRFAMTGISSPAMTNYDRLKAIMLCGEAVQSITGIPPISFTGNGNPLVSWSMLGNGSQTGTPTPDAPIMPEFVGTLDSADWTIPITNAGQTVPVNLGEVQTVRRIKKMALTGTENISYAPISGHSRFSVNGAFTTFDYRVGICSHYKYEYANANNTVYHLSSNAQKTLYILDDRYTTEADFKSYLAAQYAAGTPVTIWYVLATPETAIVNEPLAKIGDYADELSSTIPIPTAMGANTLTVYTELQPSSVTITGNIKEV